MAFVSGLVAAVLVLQVLVVGVPVIIERAQAAAVQQNLTIGFLEPIDSLNPFIGTSDSAYLLFGLLYDYMFSFDQDGNFVGNLVTSASCDTSCFNWTYQVRQGVKWSDGTNFTANDLAWTINYQLPSGSSFFHLWAYEPYLNQIVTCTNGKKTACGAQITSPWNVTIYFDRPFVPGRAVFSIIVEEAQWSGVSAQSAQTTYANPNPIGTGPFIADPNIYNEFQTGAPIHLSKNPNYHPVGNHTGPSHIDNLYLETFSDEGQMATALEKGTIQLAKMTSQGVGLVQGKPNIATQTGLESIQEWNEIGISQVDTSSADKALNSARFDRNVRRAMAMATDKNYILQTIYNGAGARGDSLMSPITPQWWYDPTKDSGANLSFNIQAANALLNASGYTTWTGGSFGNGYRAATNTISLSVQTSACLCEDPTNVTMTVSAGQVLSFSMDVRNEFPQEIATGNYLAAQWAQIGIQLTVTPKTEASLGKDVYGGSVDTYIWFWSGDPDPNYLLSIQSWVTLDGWSDNYYNNRTYNHLYVNQLADFNFTQRQKDVFAAEKQNYEDAAYIIYIFPYGEWAYNNVTWIGWGDWNKHPYRQMDAFWGANPLWFDLQYVGPGGGTNLPPTTPTLSPSGTFNAFANTTYSFTGKSSDPESTDTLTWIFGWGDKTTNTSLASATTTSVTATHAWTLPGTYNVTLTVSDGINAPVASAPTVVVVSPQVPVGYLHGTVNTTTGSPIAGATVSAGGYSQGSGANGFYNLSLPVGTYSVTATDALFKPSTVTGVAMTKGNVTWANFTLESSAGWIAGKVTSVSDGSVVGQAQVVVVNCAGICSTSTDTNGLYNLSVAPGNYTMNVTAAGFVKLTRSGVLVNGAQTSKQDFALTPVSTASPGLSPLVIAGIALIAVVVAGALLFVLLSRSRKKKEEKESEVNLPPKT